MGDNTPKPVDQVKVLEYVKIIDTTVKDEDEELVTFVIAEVVDRLNIYLNRSTLPAHIGIDRILAKVVSGLYRKYTTEMSETDPNRAIKSLTDANGQSISYSEQVLGYLTTASDNDVFTGVIGLLERYRKINVVI